MVVRERLVGDDDGAGEEADVGGAPDGADPGPDGQLVHGAGADLQNLDINSENKIGTKLQQFQTL